MKVQCEEVVRVDALTGGGGTTALPANDCGGRGATALPANDCGGRGATALPKRKRIDHRGPLSINVSGAWYFITICAEGHRSWVMTKKGGMNAAVAGATALPKTGRDVVGLAPRASRFDEIANVILHEARENHRRGIWRLALFLVMPDHLHFIVHVPMVGLAPRASREDGETNANGGRGATALPTSDCGGRGATALPRVIANFKHLMAGRYGLRFQRDFFDTRLRDEAHYAEIFHYICNNPVRRELCEAACEWPYVIAFDRVTGVEREWRGLT